MVSDKLTVDAIPCDSCYNERDSITNPIEHPFLGGKHMKKTRKWLSLLLALLMVMSLMTTAFAANSNESLKGSIVILHTNDVHGAIDGYATVAALKKDLQSKGADVLLFDAGDFLQGSSAVNNSRGQSAIDLMNAVGYDFAVPGNHEFDYGYDRLTELAKSAKFPILTSNMTYKNKSAMDGTRIFTTSGGIRIGVFGLTTPEAATKALPANVADLDFKSTNALYAAAQAQVDSLNRQNCKYIICVAHLGIDSESENNRSIDLLNHVKGIDVLIDGHSHSTLAQIQAATNEYGKVGDTYLTSTGSEFANIGKVTIDAEGNITTENLKTSSVSVTPDITVAAMVSTIQQQVENAYGQPFAISSVTLDGSKDPGVRTKETNLADLITDALLWYAKQNSLVSLPDDHVISLMNGGGIRASVSAGDVTRKDINDVLPFDNTVSVIYVTGAQLLEALEASTASLPTAMGAFPQVAGMKYVVNSGFAYDKGNLYPNSTYYAPKSINRVSVLSVNGKDFKTDDVYAVVTNNFVATGGDSYYIFTQAKNARDTGAKLDEVVMDYITTALDGKIYAAKYEKTGDRVTVLTTPAFQNVSVSKQTVTYNGKEMKLSAYAIDGYNYFQIRDIAAMVNDSDSRFSIETSGNRVIECTTGKSYAATGNEMTARGDDSNSCTPSPWILSVNGTVVNCSIYSMGGYNYFQLRDLASAIGFAVDYNAETNTVAITAD